MAYKVIHDFADIKDGLHVYHVGDAYPRSGAKADDARIKELSGHTNLVGAPLIKKVESKKKTAKE